MEKILIPHNMVKEIYVCGICNFGYSKKELAEKCEDWCNKHKSCSLEITKKSIGALTQQ